MLVVDGRVGRLDPSLDEESESDELSEGSTGSVTREIGVFCWTAADAEDEPESESEELEDEDETFLLFLFLVRFFCRVF